MIEDGLSGQPMKLGQQHKGAEQAKAMAGLNSQLKHLPDEERISRKERLLKGPSG